MRQINNGNWPDENEAQELRDELFYQRAIHAYMTMLPALNTIGMRDGSEATFGKGYNVLPIWKDRMDSRAWVPTPNGDVIYSMSYLDLKETGPLVVAAPPNVIGMFTDFFQRTITDVGAIGPDRARGGLYLLLPLGYQGHIPSSYFAFESPTYKLHLPPGIPTKAFWAVTLYNVTDGTMPETPQLLPSINSLNESIAKNQNGSIDLYFGPTKPANVADTNWIQSVKGRDFMAVIRLYGADVEFFDQTWKPDDVEKIK